MDFLIKDRTVSASACGGVILSGGCSSETRPPAKTRSAEELEAALRSAQGKGALRPGPR